MPQNIPSGSVVLLSVYKQSGLSSTTGWGWGSDINGRAYLTTDWGSTWNSASLPDSARVIVDIERYNNTLYGSGARNKFSKNLSPRNIKEMIIEAKAAGDHNRLMQLSMGITGAEDYQGAFYISSDFGSSWHYRGTMPDSVSYMKKMAVTGDGIYVCVSKTGGDRVLASTDEGRTWKYSTPHIAGLTLNDITTDGAANICAVGMVADSIEAKGIILVKPLWGNWNSKIFGEVFGFRTVAGTLDGFFFAAGDSSGNEINSLLYSTFDLQNWSRYNFDGRLKIINRIKYVMWPMSGSAIMLIDSVTANGSTPIIMKTAHYPNNGQFIAAQYFNNGTNFMILYDAYLENFNSVSIVGSDEANGLLLYNPLSDLPVELKHFSVVHSGGRIRLSWSTASELNNRGFEIERSFEDNQGQYSVVGFVNGQGTTTAETNYEFTDNPGINGVYRYRLRQFDFDGTSQLSEPVTINYNESIINTSLGYNYPNPFSKATRINFSLIAESKVTLTVYDLLGREVNIIVNEQLPAGEYSRDFVPAGNLGSGVYYYVLKTDEQTLTGIMHLIK